jgi:hypothetical protein
MVGGKKNEALLSETLSESQFFSTSHGHVIMFNNHVDVLYFGSRTMSMLCMSTHEYLNESYDNGLCVKKING